MSLALAVALLTVPFLTSSIAHADVVGGFEIDGNQDTESALDWETADVDVVTDPVGNADTSTFDGGDSENDNDEPGEDGAWGLGSPGTPSGKSDIGNVLVAQYESGGDTYAAFAWDREGDTGTGRYYIELNQQPASGINPDRTVGDFRIIVGINGSDELVCQSVATWGASGWGNTQTCDASFVVEVNSADIADYFGSPNATLQANTFLEAAINLSEFGLTTCPVTGFQSIHFRSQEGGENGDTSSLKDFASGPISIASDCGSIKIDKDVVGGDGTGAGAVFQISPNPTPGAPDSPALIVTTGADGTVTTTAEPGNYTVTELVPPTGGYLLPADNTEDVVVPEGGQVVAAFDDVLGDVRFTKSYQGDAPAGAGATFTLTRTHAWAYDGNPAGGFAAPALTDIADASFDVTDNGAGDDDAALGVIDVDGLRGGAWTIVEKSAPAGWQPAPGNVTANFQIGATDAPAERSKSLNPTGDPATFHNVLRPIAIEVVKTESVPGIPADTDLLPGVTFNLYADDGDHVNEIGVQDAPVGSAVTDASGEILFSGLDWQKDYWLQEVKKAGYEIGLSPNPMLVDLDQASPPTANDIVITVPVDNPREEVSITLHKVDGTSQADLDGGGFNLYRESNGTAGLQTGGGGDTLVNAAPKPLVAGNVTWSRNDHQLPWGYTYYIHEATAPEGYGLMTPNPIEVVTDEADANTTLTFEASDPRLPIKLTLVKVVDNGDTDGTATVQDFPLSADGPTDVTDVISGTPEATNVLVDPGDYTLSEQTLDGYTPSNWSCVGNGDAATDGQLTLDLGDTVTCTITNTAVQGTFDLLKQSDPADGSTVNEGDEITYTVTATHNGDGVDVVGAIVHDDLAGVLGAPVVVAGDEATGPLGTLDLTSLDPGVTYDEAGNRLVWTLGTLSDTASITYVVTVGAVDGATLRNHVTSDDSGNCPTNPEVEDEDCTTVHYTPDWSLDKSSDVVGSDNDAVVNPGGQITYTLTATNLSDDAPADVMVVDDIGDVLEFASLDGPLAAGLTLIDGPDADMVLDHLVWDGGVLAAGAGNSVSVSYTVTVDTFAENPDVWSQTLTNVAIPTSPGGDCVAPDECETDTDTATPEWSLDKSVEFEDPDGDGFADPGAAVTYTLTAVNTSGNADAAILVEDDLSDVLEHASIDEAALDATLSFDESTGILTWDGGVIPAGDSTSVSYTVIVNSAADDPDVWEQDLDNVATPAAPGGECIPSEGETSECETTTPTPPVTDLIVEKRAVQDDELLAGAEFEVWLDADNAGGNPVIGDCAVPADPAVDPANDELLATITTGDGEDLGQALLADLQRGCYLVVEVTAPPGYDLPEESTQFVAINDESLAGPVTVLFQDIAQGQLSVVAKQQFEFIGGEWVPSDGVVDFGDQVLYRVQVEAEGLKTFHNVEVSDYVPGFNPDDTTSTAEATLVPGSPSCTGDILCEVTVSPENLVTWSVTGTRDDEIADDVIRNLTPDEVTTGTVEMIVEFPQLPDTLPIGPGETFTTVLWNVGFLDYDEVIAITPDVAPGTAASFMAVEFLHHRLVSNEVVIEASITLPTGGILPPPPGVTPPGLPDTGAPAHLMQLGLLGGLVMLGGIVLIMGSRRRARIEA